MPDDAKDFISSIHAWLLAAVCTISGAGGAWGVNTYITPPGLPGQLTRDVRNLQKEVENLYTDPRALPDAWTRTDAVQNIALLRNRIVDLERQVDRTRDRFEAMLERLTALEQRLGSGLLERIDERVRTLEGRTR